MTTETKNKALPWHNASLGREVVAGLVGSLANTLAIRLVQLTPIPPGTGGLAKMTLANINHLAETLGLTARAPQNFGPVGQEIFHTIMGVTMAVVYALLFYHWLRGPGWTSFLWPLCRLPPRQWRPPTREPRRFPHRQ